MIKIKRFLSFMLAFLILFSIGDSFYGVEVKAANILTGESNYFMNVGNTGLQNFMEQKGEKIIDYNKNLSSFKARSNINIYDSISGSSIGTINVLSDEELIDIPLDFYVFHPVVKKNNTVYVLNSKNNKFNLSNTAQKRYIDLNKLEKEYSFHYYIDIISGDLLDVAIREGSGLTTKDLNDKDFTDSKFVASESKVLNDQGNGHSIALNYYAKQNAGFDFRYSDKDIKVKKFDLNNLKSQLKSLSEELENTHKMKNFKWGGYDRWTVNNVQWNEGELYVYGQGYRPVQKNNKTVDLPVVIVQKINILEDQSFDYEVIYKDEDGNIISKDKNTVKEGSKVTHKPKDIPGYTPVVDSPKTEIIDGPDKEIVFVYKKDKSNLNYKVIYKDQDGKVLDTENHKTKEGSKVTHKPKNITGYTPKDNKDKTVTITKEGQEIIFVYNKDKPSSSGGGSSSKRNYEYKIEYINDKNNKVIDEEYKTVRSGTEVTHKPKEIKGYIIKDNKSITKTINGKNIVFKFYYKSDGDIKYKIVYKNGDKVLDEDIKYGNDGDKVTHKPKDINGYIPVSNASKSITLKEGEDNVIYFEYETQLNKEDHFAYIQGYEDNTVRPLINVTRAEVAEVFYRLLTDNYKSQIKTTNNNFKDVERNKWYNASISTLANANIITGYEDGTFRPNQKITRAELATIAAKFDQLERVNADFSDIRGHWAEKYIGSASEKGWVNGYTDGTFRPNQAIKRAEFVTLVNNVLERKVTVQNMLSGRKEFPDLVKGKWYYEAMQEAINSHEYIKDNGSERWTKLINKTLID